MLIPVAHFDRVEQEFANARLVEWGHKMGPLNRPFPCCCYALFHNGWAVSIVAHAQLITPHVGGGLNYLRRDNSVELVRLCSVRRGLCRVALRMWREFVFPSLASQGIEYAVSYQDAELHNGNTYRFDGWERLGYSASGMDRRSGLKGRKKWIWVWMSCKNLPAGAGSQ